MSDDADKAQDRSELEDEIRKRYVIKDALEVGHTGYCLNCGEPLRGEQRWCDPFCRNDWASRQKK